MINMTEVASLIKILAVVPVGFVFSKFFYIIASNSPLKSKCKFSSFRRESLYCYFCIILIFLIISIVLSYVTVLYSDQPYEISKFCLNSSLSSSDKLFCGLEELNKDSILIFLLWILIYFILLTTAVILFQNRDKNSALTQLAINAEEEGFIQPLYESAKYNKIISVYLYDNTIYTGMLLSLSLNRYSSSTSDIYVRFLVFEKFVYSKDCSVPISVNLNEDLYNKSKKTYIDNKLISDKKVTAKGFYKDIRITNLFELYEDHSVIFKISDIKTISFNVDG